MGQIAFFSWYESQSHVNFNGHRLLLLLDKETKFCVLREGYQICNLTGLQYFSYKTLISGGQFYLFDNYVKKEWGKQKNFSVGNYISVLEIPKNVLNEGIYSITVDIFLPPALPDSSFQVRVRNVISFDIIDNYNKNSARGFYPGDWQPGNDGGYMIRPLANFETKYEGPSIKKTNKI